MASKRRSGAAEVAVPEERPNTPYEEVFGRGERGPGRPQGEQHKVAFSMKNKDRRLAAKAQTRARTLVLHRHKEEAREVFEAEYRALVHDQGYEEIVVRKIERVVERVVDREVG